MQVICHKIYFFLKVLYYGCSTCVPTNYIFNCSLFSNSTILVEPNCEACLTESGDVCLTVGSDRNCVLGTELNTVQLSIFSHRFMSIAGRTGLGLGATLFRGGAYLSWVSISLCLQNRWAESSKEPPFPPTSRSASTFPALCLDQMGA